MVKQKDGFINSRCISTFNKGFSACLLLLVISCSEILSFQDPELDHDSYYDAKVDFRVTDTVFSGDPGEAGHLDYNEALFYFPEGIAVDDEGNLFVADTYNNCIRKIDTNGITTTYAGSVNGYDGYQDGDTENARFDSPYKVTVAPDGSVYVIDYSSPYYNIRKITQEGIVTTVVRGEIFPGGIAVDNAGTVYFTDRQTDCIWKIDSSGNKVKVSGSGIEGYVDGPSDNARFDYPAGIDIDSNGNIYVADKGNYCIRKIDSNGTVSTIAGGTRGEQDGPVREAQFIEPDGIAVDNTGNIYIVEVGYYSDNTIRKISTDGMVSTIAGSSQSGFADGQGSEARFNYLNDICISPDGNIFVADKRNHCIRKVDPTGNVITFAGNNQVGHVDSGEVDALYNTPSGVCFDNAGNLLIADSNNCAIRKKEPDGTVSTIVEFPRITYLYGIAVDESDNIYVADRNNNRINIIDSSLSIHVYAGASGDYDTAGYVDGSAAMARFFEPTDISFDEEGNLYIADTGNHCIRKIDPMGNVSTLTGSGTPGYSDGTISNAQFNGPTGLDIDIEGNVYIADRNNHRIRKIDPEGKVTTITGTIGGYLDGSIAEAKFYFPADVLVDASENIYVIEDTYRESGSVRLIRNNGIVFTAYSGLGDPRGICLDTDGDLLIANGEMNYIKKISIDWE